MLHSISGYCQVNSHGAAVAPAGLPSDRHRTVPGRKGAPTQRSGIAKLTLHGRNAPAGLPLGYCQVKQGCATILG
jgi:hypothetical protein